LALGISWWALALLWQGGIVRWLLATPLLVIAFVGHPLPPLWAVAIGGYILISRRLPRERQTLLMGVAVGLLLALHVVVRFAIDSEWLPQQMSLITGVNQVYLFGGSFAVVPALAAVWLMLLGRRLFTEPWRDVLLSLPMQLVMLSAVAVAAIPQRIDLLAYIAHRASLLVAVLVCAVLAGARMRWWERAGPSLVAILFFTLLYFNTRTGNALDDRVHAVVETLPPGSRVIGIGNLTHLVDRACIGRCYSYANYEPSTGAFRVRVRGRNSIVVDDFGVSQHMQAGTYEPQPGDPSWYQLKHCDTGLCVAEISAKPGP
jgi:hypothetical protein